MVSAARARDLFQVAEFLRIQYGRLIDAIVC
jgi:hypothetical protein